MKAHSFDCIPALTFSKAQNTLEEAGLKRLDPSANINKRVNICILKKWNFFLSNIIFILKGEANFKLSLSCFASTI